MGDPFAKLFSSKERAVVVAPAGHGKTELIVRCISENPSRKQLVLTHTHAGVKSLKDRFKKYSVDHNLFHVDTIASWAFKYVKSYPKISHCIVEAPTETTAWDEIYKAFTKMLLNASIKKVVLASYGGVYVDEYQDCSQVQHKLILSLTGFLPCRIVGDPLQGVFDFDRLAPAVDWNRDVEPNFERLPDLPTPWRWQKGNSALGAWLSDLRTKLLGGDTIDLQNAPVEWRSSSTQDARNACFRLAAERSVVAIHKMPHEAHELAKSLRQTYTSMEEMYSRDLMTWAEKISKATGSKAAVILIDFSAKCMTRVVSELKTIRRGHASSNPERRQNMKHLNIFDALQKVSQQVSIESLLNALEMIEKVPGAVLFRRELWNEMKNTIRSCQSGAIVDLRKIAWNVRSRRSIIGRRLDTRVVSRVLLIKGLEFDHSVVLNADALSAKELYVAMTRGSKSLHVLSANPIIQKPRPFP